MERIKWKSRADFHQEITNQSQSGDPDLYDVFFVSEKKRISAHKLILCAASPYLKNRIKELKNTAHPDEIHLPGIRFEVLQRILQYVFYGEADVEKAHFEAFMSACQELEIKGLEQNLEIPDPETPPTKKQK